MDLILKYEDKLKLSWEPCYNKTTGVPIKYRSIKDIDLSANLPYSLWFTIETEDKELFIELWNSLNKLRLIDDIIVVSNINQNKDDFIHINPEHLYDVLDIINRNINVRSYEKESNSKRIYQPIPRKWLINNPILEMSRIDIRCFADTEIYKFLKDHGILLKYFPQYYAESLCDEYL